jgi:peptidase E
VFFGFAAGDNADYADAITTAYGGKFKVLVPTEAKGRDYATRAISIADIIYLGGGDTDQLLRVFTEWGLVDLLRAAISRGTHVAGMSAGAQALSAWYIHEDGDNFELRQGWGCVPLGLLVHATSGTYKRSQELWASSTTLGTYQFVAIGNAAAWRVDASSARKVGTGELWELGN